MKTYTGALDGYECTLVDVEAEIITGLPSFSIVGLGDKAVYEARDRIKVNLKKHGFNFPMHKIIVNLAPAMVKKHGTHFDLPIAISLLQSSGQLKSPKLEKVFCIGEIMLSGELREVKGALPIIEYAVKKGFKKIIIPEKNRTEAELISGADIYCAEKFEEIINWINGKSELEKVEYNDNYLNSISRDFIDFNSIIHNEIPKRALIIALSSKHHIALIGPPGTGKSLLAKAAIGILPELQKEEILELSRIYSLAEKGEVPVFHRPFRHVHHSTSLVTLLGGGVPLKIGEITLAHLGVLFMDEFAEFLPKAIDSLREPLEDGVVRIGRKGKTTVLPAEFQLIVAMNPCKCGYYGDKEKMCKCSDYEIKKYWKRISGPIWDRIDMVTEVGRVPPEKISENHGEGQNSPDIKKIVQKTRSIQLNRQKKLNSKLTIKDFQKFCKMDNKTNDYLNKILQKTHLSTRQYIKLIRVSRTIADLEKSEHIRLNHLSEAVQYRFNP